MGLIALAPGYVPNWRRRQESGMIRAFCCNPPAELPHTISEARQEMARKVVNRKELRAEVEAAEKAGAPKKKKTAKKTTKRKSRAKTPVEVRMKLFWGVFSQSLKRVALFEFSQKKEAEKKAQQLNKSGKSPHFVQRVKEVIKEE